MIKAKNETQNIETALGVGGNVQVVPIFIPIETYRLILEKASSEGRIVADAVAYAFRLYLQPEPPKEDPPNIAQPAQRTVDLVVRKRK